MREMRRRGLTVTCLFIMAGVFLFLFFSSENMTVEYDLSKVYDENSQSHTLFRNCLLTNVNKNSDGYYDTSFLWKNMDFTYACTSDLSVYVKNICDIQVDRGKIVDVGLKRTKIRGKVLSVQGNQIEIEGKGKFSMQEGFSLYSVFDRCYYQEPDQILIGYDNQSFILENGNICAGLTEKQFEAKTIRVLIRTTGFPTIYHDMVDFSCENSFIMKCGDTETLLNGGEILEIRKDSPYFKDEKIWIYPVGHDEIQFLSINRNKGVPSYPGTMEVRNTESGLIVINEVLLEEYLKRVVPSEMPPNYGEETAKIQAVCARSYAYRQIQNHAYASLGAHVDDSISFQVYNNSGTNEISSRAVSATTGEVLTYQGNVVSTYYFSTSCGFTTDLGIWNDEPKAAPYLTSICLDSYLNGLAGHGHESEEGNAADAAAQIQSENVFEKFIKNDRNGLENSYPWYRWQFDIDISELSERINLKLSEGRDILNGHILVMQENGSFEKGTVENAGTVVSMKILERGAGGIASKLFVEGTETSFVICRQSAIRFVLGSSSQIYSNGLANETSGTGQLPSAFICLEERKENDEICGYRIYGGGNGHGLGMSQNGAYELTKRGLSYREVLSVFFPGTEIEKKQNEY